jgi:hypothetical protein
LASSSGGKFYDNASPESFSNIVLGELGALRPTAAQNVRLRLRRLDFCDGIEPLGEHRHSAEEIGAGVVEYSIPDLLAGEERTICFNLEVPTLPAIDDQPFDSLENEALLDLEVSYNLIEPRAIRSERFWQRVQIARAQAPGSTKETNALIRFQ